MDRDVAGAPGCLVKFGVGLAGLVIGVAFGGAGALAVCVVLGRGTSLGAGPIAIYAVPVAGLLGGCTGIPLALRVLRYFREYNPDSSRRSSRRRLAVGLAAGLPASFAAMLLTIHFYAEPPWDSQVISNFERHQPELNQIVEIMKNDPAMRQVGNVWTQPDDMAAIQVSPDRIRLYRKLLEQAHTPGGIRVPVPSEQIDIAFWIDSNGLSSVSIKGYAYRAHPSKQVIAGQEDAAIGRYTYRHLQGNWYLFTQ